MRNIQRFIIAVGLLGMAAFIGAEEMPLVVATRSYPHVEPIRNGAVKIPECRIIYSTLSASDLTRKFNEGSAGDVIEVDIATYLKKISAEEHRDWVLVPVFLWREFPHHRLFKLNSSSATYAVNDKNQTLRLWAQGILSSSMTAASVMYSSAGAMAPAFSDPKALEQEYFHHTRIFPAITALAVRAELVQANAWLPEALFIAFSDAKQKTLEAGTIPLPWGEEHREETIKLMGKNYWSYGVKNNPKTLHALFDYAFKQGITSKELEAEDVFADETLELIDDNGAKN